MCPEILIRENMDMGMHLDIDTDLNMDMDMDTDKDMDVDIHRYAQDMDTDMEIHRYARDMDKDDCQIKMAIGLIYAKVRRTHKMAKLLVVLSKE
jgi:hypothetical protein